MKHIRTIHDPSILIRDIQVDKRAEFYYNQKDLEAGFGMPNYGEDFSKRTGLHDIFIFLNGMTIKTDQVERCTIDLTKKYPTITMRITPDFDDVINIGMPKDGDLVSIFYRSVAKELKPLRLDFIITDISNESNNTFVVFGVLNVPKLFLDSSTVYEDQTSLDALINISKDLELGFATNETMMSDEQNWVCANQPFDLFIDEVKGHSWKDERSFFDAFIDQYYTLNFVNVFEQLDAEKEKKVNLGINIFRKWAQTNKHQQYKIEEEVLKYNHPVVLHNWAFNIALENKITQLDVVNNSSRISLEEGYQKFFHFYDLNTDTKEELMVESVHSRNNSEEAMPLKGNLFNEAWRTNTRHNWGGISYAKNNHNVHPFYYYAKAHNYHNLREIDKFTIEVTLAQVNFNLYRYMVVPLLWYEYGDTAEDFNSRYQDEETVDRNGHYKLNNFLSGFYVLKGSYIDYIGASPANPSTVTQKIILTRVEVPKVVETPEDGKILTNIVEG